MIDEDVEKAAADQLYRFMLLLFMGLFDKERVSGGPVAQYERDGIIYRFAEHAGHQMLGICLEEVPGKHIDLWLFGNRKEEERREERYKELVENSLIEQLYTIGWRWDHAVPIHLSESTHDNRYWAGDDWPIAYLNAKVGLINHLINLLQWRARALEIDQRVKRLEHTPADKDRYLPLVVPAKPVDSVLTIRMSRYPMGGCSYQPLEEELFTGSLAGQNPMPMRLDPQIPLSTSQAEQLGRALANFIWNLAEVGGIETIYVMRTGITLHPEAGCSLDSQRIAKLIAEAFGYSQYTLEEGI